MGRLRLLTCLVLPLLLALSMTALFVPLQQKHAEEYLELGQQSPSESSSLFRPPGYVAFLRYINLASGGIAKDRLMPVYVAQGVALGLATAVFYITACRWMTGLGAWLMAMAFGCNPLVVVLVGFVHYDILHMSLSVLVGYSLVRAFAGDRASLRWAIFAGIACGAMTLTRPMTLALPAFLALALLIQTKSARPSRPCLAWMMFSLAMAATLAPRIWGNYARTGRFVPVNEQAVAALWPMFERPLRPDSDTSPWPSLWNERGVPLVGQGLGPDATYPYYAISHPLEFNDVLHAQTLRLMRTQPQVYLQNLAYNALFFLTGDSRTMIRMFMARQDAAPRALPAALAVGFFIASSALWNLCGALGLALGLWRRDPAIMVLASLFICIFAVHSMLFLDYRYIYVKLPFSLWFCGYLVNDCLKLPRVGERLLTWMPATFAAISLFGTALLVV